MSAEFTAYMTDLRRIKVDRALAQPLMARALDLQFDDLGATEARQRKRAEDRRRWFKSVAPDLVEKYGTEFHEMTAYTVFNAATDFASSASRGAHQRHLPRLAGRCRPVGRFVPCGDARPGGFSLDSYVGVPRTTAIRTEPVG